MTTSGHVGLMVDYWEVSGCNTDRSVGDCTAVEP